MSPGTAGRAADAGGRVRGGAPPADRHVPFALVDSVTEAGTGGEPGIRASGRLPQAVPARGGVRIRAIVDGRRPCWAAQRIRETGVASGAIESRRDVARIGGRKAARHLRSRVQRSGRKAALACSTSARVAPGSDTSTHRDPGGCGGTVGCLPCRAPVDPLQPAACRRGRTFCTSIKAARSGPHAPPLGRASVAPLTLRLRPSNTPGGWRGSGKPKGPPQHDRPLTREVVGRQPAGPRGHEPRGVGSARRPRRRASGGLGLRLLRLRRGRSGSRMAGAPSAGHGPWVVAVGHPACHRPGQAEQTTARPASARACVKAVLTWRAGQRPASQEGGPTADGMPTRRLRAYAR
ncbi:hypothetical protein GA0070561_1450 [Micromonospora saelicesensis]|uniref:Uncharacterized protein n=1 Tax=Micromonospora saelicesensis TaxID=285676 RepID=A0A1C4UXF9_9ACTN|nr:hypothetical protein GA0070561_1450 [Micromonospora saelicesensis]